MFKKNQIAFLVGLLFLAFIAFWSFKTGASDEDPSENVNLEKNSRPRSREANVQQGPLEKKEIGNPALNEFKIPFSSPIDFWGKVIDEEGRPVEGASITATMLDDASWSFSTSSNTRVHTITKIDGTFEILGRKGARISVEAKKKGYSPSIDQEVGTRRSKAQISYVGKDDNLHHKRPTKKAPTILILRKEHPLANLGSSSVKQVDLSKEGESGEVILKSPQFEITFKVRCWSSSPVPFTYDKYDWRAEIKVVGGKLQPITEYDPVTAPIDGYVMTFLIDMPKGTKENWQRSSPNGTSNFWIQFDDGSYAKVHIEIKTGRKHTVDAEVWYNLDGTNNFEQ